VSSDIVASMIMKPIGRRALQARLGEQRAREVAGHGSVPSAFLGVVLLKTLGHGAALAGRRQNRAPGRALGRRPSVSSCGHCSRARAAWRQHDADQVKKLPTLFIGIAGGLIVGLTSSAPLAMIINAAHALFPASSCPSWSAPIWCRRSPLVASAALGHILFGRLQVCRDGVHFGGAFRASSSRAALVARADSRHSPALIIVLLALPQAARRVEPAPGTAVGAVALVMLGRELRLKARRKAAEPKSAARRDATAPLNQQGDGEAGSCDPKSLFVRAGSISARRYCSDWRARGSAKRANPMRVC